MSRSRPASSTIATVNHGREPGGDAPLSADASPQYTRTSVTASFLLPGQPRRPLGGGARSLPLSSLPLVGRPDNTHYSGRRRHTRSPVPALSALATGLADGRALVTGLM